MIASLLFFSLLFSLCGCNFVFPGQIKYKYEVKEEGTILTGYVVDKNYEIPENLEIPNVLGGKNVIEIGDSAFFDSNFKKITLPKTIKKIGTLAFASSDLLCEINTPEALTVINNYAFENCISLKSFDLPEKLDYLGDLSFENAGLEKITLVQPQRFGFNIFSNSKIEEIKFGENVSTIFVGEFAGSKVTNIIFPEKIKSISDSAFAGCEDLSDIAFEEGLEGLYSKSFSNCKKLKDVTFPKSVKFIANDAFDGCQKNMVIYAESGSYAASWAKTSGFKLREY